jgi:hypothetical protein
MKLLGMKVAKGSEGVQSFSKSGDSLAQGYGPVAGCCEHGNEPSGFSKRRIIFVQLNDYQLLHGVNRAG